MGILGRIDGDDEPEVFSDSLVTLLDPGGIASEAYRTLRTNLLYSVMDEAPRVIATTSPGPGEGKSTTCANLSVTLTQAGNSCVLLDCDLRRPAVHKVFGMRTVVGMVDYLAGQRDLEDVWQEALPGLKVVPTGPIPPNPTEVLSSGRFAEFLVRMRREFDYVLIDTPPIELVSDAVVVATQCDGVLLVFDGQRTRRVAVRKSVQKLEAVGANILGTVMNNVKPSRGSTYYGNGGYGYS